MMQACDRSAWRVRGIWAGSVVLSCLLAGALWISRAGSSRTEESRLAEGSAPGSVAPPIDVEDNGRGAGATTPQQAPFTIDLTVDRDAYQLYSTPLTCTVVLRNAGPAPALVRLPGLAFGHFFAPPSGEEERQRRWARDHGQGIVTIVDDGFIPFAQKTGEQAMDYVTLAPGTELSKEFTYRPSRLGTMTFRARYENLSAVSREGIRAWTGAVEKVAIVKVVWRRLALHGAVYALANSSDPVLRRQAAAQLSRHKGDSGANVAVLALRRALGDSDKEVARIAEDDLRAIYAVHSAIAGSAENRLARLHELQFGSLEPVLAWADKVAADCPEAVAELSRLSSVAPDGWPAEAAE